MRESDLQQLISLLSAVDEDYLVALANRGLYRRAVKDLEESKLTHEVKDSEVMVHGPDWKVRMPKEGPTMASDDTKATGVTRQILSATIYLKEVLCKTGNVEEYPQQDIRPALTAICVDSLAKWTGKKVFAEAILLLEEIEIEIRQEKTLTVRFSEHGIQVHMPSSQLTGTALLEAILSSAPKEQHKLWVALAILALKQETGADISSEIQSAQEKSVDTEGRNELFKNTLMSIEAIMENGIAHVSERTSERLSSLAISAGALNLPRLSHQLKTISVDVDQLLQKNAAVDTQRFFNSLCLNYFLVMAMSANTTAIPKELSGMVRSQYYQAGTLELQALAAYPWLTPSGFEGLTVLFWEQNRQRFLTWTNSRPLQNAVGFHASSAYTTEPPWSGSKSPEKLCGLHLTLLEARINDNGRVSSRQETWAKVAESEVERTQINFGSKEYANWQHLAEYAARQFPVGLRLPDPLNRIVIVTPKLWGDRYYDELQQALCWTIFDETNQSLMLTVPWNKTNENIIDFFECLKPDECNAKKIVGRIVFSGVGFAIEPISLICDNPDRKMQILNPAFDRAKIASLPKEQRTLWKRTYNSGKIKTKMTNKSDWEEEMQLSLLDSTFPPVIRNLLAEVESFALGLAESGSKSYNERHQKRLSTLMLGAEDFGMSEISESLKLLQNKEDASTNLLWCGYLCQLHWQSMMQFKIA